jgi:hypothetical protein
MMRAHAVAIGCAAAGLYALPAHAQNLEPPPPLSQPAPGYPSPGYVPGAATSGPMTARRNADDESKDSGLGLEWVWLTADVGAAYVGLDSLNSSKLELQTTKSSGPSFSVGAGVRLLFLTVGVRARDLLLSNLSLWEVNGEVAFHTRIDHVDPYFGFRGGYAFDGSLGSGTVQEINGSSPSLSVHGWNVGPFLGCDYYFNHYLSVGLELNVEFLFLQRPPVVNLPPAFLAQLTAEEKQAYQESGSSVGFGANGAAHIGLHF